MNAQVKQKWIEALRSGEFQQGKRALRIEDKYCCLGVLCELYRRETGQGEWLTVNGSPLKRFRDGTLKTYRDSFGLLPDGVVEWADVISSDGLFAHNDGKQTTLTECNDGGATFEEIAKLIEDYF